MALNQAVSPLTTPYTLSPSTFLNHPYKSSFSGFIVPANRLRKAWTLSSLRCQGAEGRGRRATGVVSVAARGGGFGIPVRRSVDEIVEQEVVTVVETESRAPPAAQHNGMAFSSWHIIGGLALGALVAGFFVAKKIPDSKKTESVGSVRKLVDRGFLRSDRNEMPNPLGALLPEDFMYTKEVIPQTKAEDIARNRERRKLENKGYKRPVFVTEGEETPPGVDPAAVVYIPKKHPVWDAGQDEVSEEVLRRRLSNRSGPSDADIELMDKLRRQAAEQDAAAGGQYRRGAPVTDPSKNIFLTGGLSAQEREKLEEDEPEDRQPRGPRNWK